jgi:hypothetical protein
MTTTDASRIDHLFTAFIGLCANFAAVLVRAGVSRPHGPS